MYWSQSRLLANRLFAQVILLCAVLLWLITGVASAQERSLQVGVYENEPKVFTNADGEPDGIFIEILQKIAAREDWALGYIHCGWDACLQALQRGEIDLLPDVAYSDARAQRYDFHLHPVLHSWSQVFVPRQSEVVSLFQLQDKRIAVLRDSVQHDQFPDYLQEFGIDATLVPVDDLAQAFATTAAGDADAMISNHTYGQLHAQRYGLKATPVVFDPAKLFYATGLGRHAQTLADIDFWLAQWRDDEASIYYQILNRWEAVSQRFVVPVVIWWLLGGVIALALLAMGIAAWLRRQVAIKTKHLQESEQKLATILDSVGAYIYIKDQDLRYVYINRRVQEFFGRPREQILGAGDEDFFDAATTQRIQADDRYVLESGRRVTAEERGLTDTSDQERTFLAIKIPLKDANGQVYAVCGLSTDITERKQHEEVVRQLAYFDALTGLPNRSYLMHRLQVALTRQSQSQVRALIYADLDNFKDLNDIVGHETGDELLREVALRLRDLVESEEQLARLGGDEFAVLLISPDSQPEQVRLQAQQMAEKIRCALQDVFHLGDFRHHGTSSIGVALVSEHDGTTAAEKLLQQAELAMYQAKQSGRNTICFFSAATQGAYADRVALETDLRSAVQARQLRLFYQPQVDKNQRLIGAEALIRWFHPTRGVVGPTVFIPVAERIGLVSRIGRWVLQTACEQLASWQHNPAMSELTLAVNVSARQFRSVGFVEEVLEIIEQTGAPRDKLKLELTETLLIEDLEEAAERINQLANQHIRVSLDDFGTGYSSLAYLQLLPLSQLKIDKSFVLKILTDPVADTIAHSIVSLADALGVEVIAEGVETPEQRDRLAELGCQLYQGYLFGRPEEVSALQQLAERQ